MIMFYHFGMIYACYLKIDTLKSLNGICLLMKQSLSVHNDNDSRFILRFPFHLTDHELFLFIPVLSSACNYVSPGHHGNIENA